jgi:hypothetical protein
MAYKIKTKMKGFSYQKYYEKMFHKSIKVEKVAENQQTGETHALISSKTHPKNYSIVYTKEDIAYYGKNEKEAKKKFKEFHEK